MAFGISGDDTRTFMVGADVVVAWIGLDGVANAVDYYLTSRQQVKNLIKIGLLVSVRGISSYSVVVVVECVQIV